MSLNVMPSDMSEGLLLPTLAQQHGSPPQVVRSWYERPVRILILLSFLVLVADCFLVFFFEDELRGAGWDRLLEYDDSYDTPVGWTAGVMALIFVLVALVGAHAQQQAQVEQSGLRRLFQHVGICITTRTVHGLR